MGIAAIPRGMGGIGQSLGALGERLRGHLPRACRRGGAGSLLRDHLDRLLVVLAAAGRDGWPGGERRGQAMQEEAEASSATAWIGCVWLLVELASGRASWHG